MSKKVNKEKRVIYIIGSLRNKNVPIIANKLRKDLGKKVEIVDDWYYCSEDADDWLKECCKNRGLNYKQTLSTLAAKHVFQFDFTHLTRATDVICIAPFGRSCALELGWSIGKGKHGFILFNEQPERVDIMLQFVPIDNICFDYRELLNQLKKY